jgi:hypothetical protein
MKSYRIDMGYYYPHRQQSYQRHRRRRIRRRALRAVYVLLWTLILASLSAIVLYACTPEEKEVLIKKEKTF